MASLVAPLLPKTAIQSADDERVVTVSDFLFLQLKKDYDFICAFTDAANHVIDSKSNALGCKVTKFLDWRFVNCTSLQIWNAIITAQNSKGAVPQGVTYVARSRERAQDNYIGKTTNTMKDRYPGGPSKGGLEAIFANHTPSDMLDITLYWTDSPALVEGWCYTVAKARDTNIILKNIHDPT